MAKVSLLYGVGVQLFAVGLHASIFMLILWNNSRVSPTVREAAMRQDLPLARFSSARAMHHVRAIDAFGPRPVGTYPNEVQAPQYLFRAVQGAVENAFPDAVVETRQSFAGSEHVDFAWPVRTPQAGSYNIKIEVERQMATGDFEIGFLGGVVLSYSNISNVLVRVSWQKEDQGARDDADYLLISSHYDTQPGTVATADCTAHIASMIELFQNIIAGPPQEMGIVFNFNGAEETFLMGAHAFLSHPWAENIRAFLNLESVGTGGPLLMFQVSPKASWLLEAYARAVSHPFGSVRSASSLTSICSYLWQRLARRSSTRASLTRKQTILSITNSAGILVWILPGFIQGNSTIRLEIVWITLSHIQSSKQVLLAKILLGTLASGEPLPSDWQFARVISGSNTLALVTEICQAWAHQRGQEASSDPTPSSKLVFFDLFNLKLIYYAFPTHQKVSLAILTLLAVHTTYIEGVPLLRSARAALCHFMGLLCSIVLNACISSFIAYGLQSTLSW
eukprot:scaffold234_cov406-Prasinococcus_capsulatus_cf.AAC.7